MFFPRISGETAGIDSREKYLWRAVLFQAIHDSLGFVGFTGGDRGAGSKRMWAKRAVAFFHDDPVGLSLVCGASDLDFARVRSAVIQAIECRWGAEPFKAIDAEPPGKMTRGYLTKVAQDRNSHPIIRAIIGSADAS